MKRLIHRDQALYKLTLTYWGMASTKRPTTRTRPPANRRERHKLRTRAALLDAASSLLVERSIDALSVNEITTRADVAKGTFYNYFADKDALTRELQRDVRAHIEDEIARTNAGLKDPAVRIARALCCVLRLGLHERPLMVATARLFPHATDPSAPQNTGVRKDVVAGLTGRRITAASPDAPIAAIIGVCMAGVNRIIDLEQERREAFARDLGMILLHGLGLSHAESARVMRAAVESVLATAREAHQLSPSSSRPTLAGLHSPASKRLCEGRYHAK